LVELTGAPSMLALRKMLAENIEAVLTQYSLPSVAAPVHLVHAKEFRAPTSPVHDELDEHAAPDTGFIRTAEEHDLADLGWSRLGLEFASIVTVPGNHFSMFWYPETAAQIDALFEPDLYPAGTQPPADDRFADIWKGFGPLEKEVQ